MDLPEALAGVAAYSSLQNLPLIGIKGLRLYLRPFKTPDQARRMKCDLAIFNDRFCKVLALMSREASQAMVTNVCVYKGILSLYRGDQKALEEVSKEFSTLASLINDILQEKPVERPAIESYVERLRELSEEAGRSLQRAGADILSMSQFAAS